MFVVSVSTAPACIFGSSASIGSKAGVDVGVGEGDDLFAY
jgi:hypothetical protein